MVASLLLFPFKIDLRHDLVKEIIGHQQGDVFRLDSQNLKCEIHHFFHIIFAIWQIVDFFFTFFDRFGDVIFYFFDAMQDVCLPFSYPLCLVRISLF